MEQSLQALRSGLIAGVDPRMRAFVFFPDREFASPMIFAHDVNELSSTLSILFVIH
jgi:hypothetical protein